MASISRDPSGRFRVQFVAPDGARKTVRLPTGDRRAAEAVAKHVDALLAAKLAGIPMPRETAAWLADLPDLLRQRLAAAGLTEAPQRPPQATLGAFLAEYLAQRNDLGRGTLIVMQQAARHLWLCSVRMPRWRMSLRPTRTGSRRGWSAAASRKAPSPSGAATPGTTSLWPSGGS